MTNDTLPRPPTGYLGLATFVAHVLQHLALDGDRRPGRPRLVGRVSPSGHCHLDGPV